MNLRAFGNRQYAWGISGEVMRTIIAITIATLALAASSAASAQDTTCRKVGDTVKCTTDNSDAEFAAAMRAKRAREQAEADRHSAQMSARNAEIDRREAEEDAAAINHRIAELVRTGQCEQARDYALRKGKLDAADMAMRVCRPAPPAP